MSEAETERDVWDLARLSLDTHLRLLERTDQTAQALVAAATLSGSLAAPLLVLGLPRKLWVLVGFGALLCVYIITLGLALKSALRLLFAASGHRPPGRGFLHYSHTSSYASDAELLAVITTAVEQGKHGTIVTDIRSIANVIELKVAQVDRTIRHVQVSYVALACLVIFRFVSVF